MYPKAGTNLEDSIKANNHNVEGYNNLISQILDNLQL